MLPSSSSECTRRQVHNRRIAGVNSCLGSAPASLISRPPGQMKIAIWATPPSGATCDPRRSNRALLILWAILRALYRATPLLGGLIVAAHANASVHAGLDPLLGLDGAASSQQQAQIARSSLRSAGSAYRSHCHDVQRPHSPTEFLENLKQIYRCDLLSHEDFYSSKNLTTTFGGDNIVLWWSTPTAAAWRIDHLGDLFRATAAFGSNGVNVTRTIDSRQSSTPKVLKAGIGLNVGHDDRLTVELAKQVFGAPESVTNAVGSGLPGSPTTWAYKTTDPFGNKALIYKVTSRNERYVMYIITFGDGTIGPLTLLYDDYK